MADRNITVELAEKKIIEVDISDKEIISVNFNTIDALPKKLYIYELDDISINNLQDKDILQYDESLGLWVNKSLEDVETELAKIIKNETPIAVNPLPSKQFRVIHAFRVNSLEVFLNGLKIHSSEITIISNKKFEFPLDIISTDKVECNYIKE